LGSEGYSSGWCRRGRAGCAFMECSAVGHDSHFGVFRRSEACGKLKVERMQIARRGEPRVNGMSEGERAV